MINSVRIFSYQNLLEMIYSSKFVIFINFPSSVALEAVDFISYRIAKLLPSGKETRERISTDVKVINNRCFVFFFSGMEIYDIF